MTPTSIIIRIIISGIAFSAANQSERPLARAGGLAVLVALGVMFIFGSVGSGSLLYGALGLGLLAAASYAFWTHR